LTFQQTYLGKKKPESGLLIKSRKGTSPRLARDYGHVYLLQELSRRIGLSEILEKVFPESHKLLSALAFFEICEAEPLYLFPLWFESAYLPDSDGIGAKDLTKITGILGRMEREWLEFSRQWIHKATPVTSHPYPLTLNC